MQPAFWLNRWRDGQTAFHQARVSRHLERHWPLVCQNARAQVFVPLCGKSLDLLWLRDRGHEVHGVELSTVAVETFHQENGLAARRCVSPAIDRFDSLRMSVHCGDFFALHADMLKVEAVYDRAALIAWAPDQRAGYVDRMASLTPRGTNTLLVAMEYRQEQLAGPPFSLDATEVERLYGASHRIQLLSHEDILEQEPRMRARGATQLHEACYHLTRL